MKYIILLFALLSITACGGGLWYSEPRVATNGSDITIRLFENDPLWEYYGEYWK